MKIEEVEVNFKNKTKAFLLEAISSYKQLLIKYEHDLVKAHKSVNHLHQKTLTLEQNLKQTQQTLHNALEDSLLLEIMGGIATGVAGTSLGLFIGLFI